MRGRAAFAALRGPGVRRARQGSVTIVHRGDPDLVPPAVAFAIGRRVGSAVRRNRVRRRLRAILARAAQDGHLATGTYLVNVAPGATSMSFEQLEHDVHLILIRLRDSAGSNA